MSDQRFIDALRRLQLPIPHAHEDAALAQVRQTLGNIGVVEGDWALLIESEITQWVAQPRPAAILKQIIDAAFTALPPSLGALGVAYWRLLESLTDKPDFMSVHAARRFLAQAPLMVRLAQEERMSAAQISRVLTTADSRLHTSWDSVSRVLATLRLSPKLILESVQQLFILERTLEEEVFADAPLPLCADLVAEAARELGFPGELRTLLDPVFLTEMPYYAALHVLHFCCGTVEFFDHLSAIPYEFSPRGQASNWLFEQYPAAIKTGQNPFLNVAKGVYRLDEAWALPRERHDFLAMTGILSGLDQMGWPARRSLARQLRLLTLRTLKPWLETSRPLPNTFTTIQTRRLLQAVATDGTHTRGILEQRSLDLISGMLHPKSSGWSARGLGDSVNASNWSSRKLGDCEFLHVGEKRIVAYESHGGILKDYYIEDHFVSFARVLTERAQDLRMLAPAEQWAIEVVFVGHAMEATAGTRNLSGFQITHRAVTFADLFGTHSPPPASVRQLMIDPLNAPHTPETVRTKTREICGL